MEGDDHGVARGLVQAGTRGESFCDADRGRFTSRWFREDPQPTTQALDAAALQEALDPTGTDELQAVQHPGQIAHGHDQHALENTQAMRHHLLANEVHMIRWCRP